MKILQIGKFYPIRGGVEKVMYDLMSGLSARQVHCDMLCASTEDFPAGTTPINAFAKLIVVKTTVKAAATMLAPAMISKLRAIAADYEIIHIHHPDPMACLALFLSGYQGKVVLHWHSDILKQKTLMKLYAPLQKWLIKRADLIVGTSPVYVKSSASLAAVQSKVDFIPIGVASVVADAGKVQAIREKYKGKKIIFSLGRLVTYKGFEYLIKAAAQLNERYQLIIGGTGPLREELEALVLELGIQHRVKFIGFVADDQLPAYFEACDLFCLSSIWKTEAFAIVQIEAMSFAKPVVSTLIPGSGVSWVNEHGVSGLVAAVADEQSMAKAIQQIFADPAYYKQLAEGSRQRYENCFTTAKMIDKCVLLYTKVLAS